MLRSSTASELSGIPVLRTEGYRHESVMKVHSDVLSSASGFFRSLIDSCRAAPRRMCPDCGGPERTVVTCQMQGRKFEAAHHVTNYMYTNQLPTNNGCVPDEMHLLLIWMIKVCNNTYISAVRIVGLQSCTL